MPASDHPTPVAGSAPAVPPDGAARRHALGFWGKALLVGAIVAGFGVWCVGLPAQAASLAASSASSALDSLSTSVGAFSNAVSGLSTSSSPGGGKVAQGHYRIEQIRPLPGAGESVRVAIDLRPDEAEQAGVRPSWQLRVPAQTAARAELEPGQLVEVRERAYGWALSRAGADQPFYLVVHDEWAQGLPARPVGPTR